jgi:hypothetical protein
MPAKRLLTWLNLGTSKFHDWRDRYGKVNEHNGWVPRDHWLEDWEKRAVLDFHNRYPLDGYHDWSNSQWCELNDRSSCPKTLLRQLTQGDMAGCSGRTIRRVAIGQSEAIHFLVDVVC